MRRLTGLDATFLYMIAMRQFYEMFHDNQLLDELWSNIQTAFHWALTYSDMDNDGLVEYERRNPNGHGLQRYGFEQEARLLASSVMRAINAFTLPVELYCVLPSRWIREPRLESEWLLADYPQSCSVQAWTAAAILYFIALLEAE